MTAISVTGLLSNSFDWQSVVNQLITIDSAPVTQLQNETTTNNNKLASLATIKTALTDLQTSAISLRSSTLFTSRTVASDTTGSNWNLTATNGATAGSYTIAVANLATAARRVGATGVAAGLSTTDSVAGVTLANMPTSTAVTAGTFTVNGKTVTIALTDSLADVFTKISDATGGKVTGSYDHSSDKVTLASTDSSEVVLGAVNDSSNFLSVMGLANNASSSVSSAARLGSVSLNATIANANLAGTLSADGSGNGSFTINGVSIAYNVNTDSLNNVLSRINSSTAGVTASYDAANNRFSLVNNSTGDVGIGANEGSGGLLDAMGLTGGSTFQHGQNAQFSINGGATITSASNTLSASVLGVPGLTVKVNSTGTQTITVAADTATMKSAIQDFIDKFNTVQSSIDSETAISIGTNGTVTTATLGGNHDVESWGSDLRALAFNAIGGTRLADLGIDFSSLNSTLSITDSTKLDTALASNTSTLNTFFSNTTTGFAQQFSKYLTGLLNANTGGIATQTTTINKQNANISDQINALNTRLASERTQLTTAFLAMQNAQSTALTQQQTINGMFSSSSSCWVARAVYGSANPRWLLFRFWLLNRAPGWFRALYLRHGERVADWLGDKPWLRSAIRRWMDTRIATLAV